MGYHKWSSKELLRVEKYIARTKQPLSAEKVTAFAESLGLSVSSVRGMIGRVMKTRKEEDII